MKYPKFIKKNDYIEVVAPSFGCNKEPYLTRIDFANSLFESLGYKIRIGSCVFSFNKTSSAKPIDRAKEFIDAYFNNDSSLIFAFSGGEVEMEMMPFLDTNSLLKAEPKWFIGYSDNTNLCLYLTTVLDVASIYSYNYSSFGVRSLHESQKQVIDILMGKNTIQHSYPKFSYPKYGDLDYTAPINPDIQTSWKTLNNEKSIEISGRIIGGCLDVIQCSLGSPYENIKGFIDKYKNDGIIMYFESCDLNILSQYRAYLQLIRAGYINDVKAILIGRPLNNESFGDYSYLNMLHDAFDNLNIPVIYDVDIGHTSPTHTIINGSIVTIKYSNKKGSIETSLI